MKLTHTFAFNLFQFKYSRFEYKGCIFRVHPFRFAKVAQLVEHNLAKVRVAGSSPVFRSLPKGLGIACNIGAFYFIQLPSVVRLKNNIYLCYN